MNKKRTYLIIHLSFSVLLALPPLKDKNIESFMIARYDGDTAMVHSFLSENFTYEHAPYVGLGIDAYYVDGSALVTHVVDDSIQNQLSVGDRIHELNGAIIDSNGMHIRGPVGEIQDLIVTKAGDSLFTALKIPLSRFQYDQNASLFLESIVKYSEAWYDYDIEIIKIISRRNQFVVHYEWEGSKHESGPTYHFSAIEIILLNKKRTLIEKVEGLWSEKQFRDQFK